MLFFVHAIPFGARPELKTICNLLVKTPYQVTLNAEERIKH